MLPMIVQRHKAILIAVRKEDQENHSSPQEQEIKKCAAPLLIFHIFRY